MPLSEKQMSHPRFVAMNDAVHEALFEAARKFDISREDISQLETHAGRVVDDMTALLIRAYDLNHVSEAAS